MTKAFVSRRRLPVDTARPDHPMRGARKLLVTLVVLVALAVAVSAQAATTQSAGSTTQIWATVGWKDGGHVYLDWHSETYVPGWKAGVLSVEVATSPQVGSDGFYAENLVDYGYIDSYANPGRWVSSWKLDPGTYYVLIQYQFAGPDYQWESKWSSSGPRTITIPAPLPPPPPPVVTPPVNDGSWDTCANAIRIAKSFFGSHGKWKGCRYLGAHAWQPTVRRHVSKRWDVIKAINVYVTGRNQGDAVVAGQRRVRR